MLNVMKELKGPGKTLTFVPTELRLAQPLKWSWACRSVPWSGLQDEYFLQQPGDKPEPGDFAVVRVENVDHHRFLETDSGRRLRLYPADRLVCAFGNRYATDVYEGRVLNLNRLHLLSGSGVIGTVLSRNRDAGPPTRLSFLGYVTDAAGKRVNSIDRKFSPVAARTRAVDVVVVAGTGMSTEKPPLCAGFCMDSVRVEFASPGAN